MKKLLYFMAAGVFLASCTKLELNKETTIQPLENYHLDYHTYFRIDSIHDYRCPADLECLWSGNADIFISGSDGVVLVNILAQLYSDTHNPVYIGNYRIKILDVLPYRKSGDAFNLNDERVKIVISKN